MGAETVNVEAYEIALVQAGAVKVAPGPDNLFELRSGPESWVYVDHGDILCQPETYRPYITVLAEVVRDNFPEQSTILVNVDSKSSPHTVGALASVLRLRQVVVTPQATSLAEKGSKLAVRLPQEIEPNDTLLVVDDVFTEGDTTAADVIERVRSAIIGRLGETQQDVHLIVGLLRGDRQKATRQLGVLGIKLHWLTTIESVLQKIWPALTPVQQQALAQGGFNLSSGQIIEPSS